MLYLLHFDPPYCHARHYLGYTENLEQRLQVHVGKDKEHGSPLVKAVVQGGGKVILTRLWVNGSRTEERQKKQKGKAGICPLCRGKFGPYFVVVERGE